MLNVVQYRADGPIVTITLNRPDRLNALNKDVLAALAGGLDKAARNDDVKVVVLTGRGRAFSAGFDMTEEIEDNTETPLEWLPVLQRDMDVTMRLWSFPKPTIAAVHGFCLGGACELAMACDIIVAAADAQFGEPEIRYGSGPVTLLMPFVIGQKKTNELLLTGDRIDAEEAARLGLVNRVVPLSELEASTKDLARRIAPTPLEILRLTKETIRRAYEAMGLVAAVQSNLHISSMINGANTPEQQEFDDIARLQGLKAALQWRDARYGFEAELTPRWPTE